LYQSDGRAPYASINFVTAHDGFTLRDLVSFNDKHNLANGEDNRDGESHNRSWNCGIEGPTDDLQVLALRSRQQRNLLATLLLSQGVPMLLQGDELGRSQGGNNNAYCQDNEISWIDWAEVDAELFEFTRGLLALRAEHPVFRRRRFFTGDADADGVPDIAWLRADGAAMSDDDWSAVPMRPLAVFLNGEAITGPGPRGEAIRDDSFLLLINPGHEDCSMVLPGGRFGKQWEPVLDTAAAPVGEPEPVDEAGEEREVSARSVVVLRRA
ncbi:MAG: glycogen debranching enzyme, partial [Nocardioidaceae bacterium]